MAKFKEVLDWVTLDATTFPPALKALDDELREAFKMVKEIKGRYEPELDKVLCKIAPALDAETKEKLKIDARGKFPPATIRKFSYMRGVAVATANAPKGKSGVGGIRIA